MLYFVFLSRRWLRVFFASSECVSWFLGRLYWLHWVSFSLSECVLSLLVVGGWEDPLLECVWFLGRLYWLHWVSFCLSECALSLLVVGG